MCSRKKVNVLLLNPSASALQFVKLFPNADNRYNFVIETATFPTFQGLVEFGNNIIKQKNIQIVLALNNDCRALLKAALTVENCSLPSPSLESVFLCVHKYYTHLMIDPEPIPYSYLDLSACSDAYQKALDIVTLPAFVKPCTGNRSRGVAVVQSKDHLREVVEPWEGKGVFTAIKSNQTYINSFFVNSLDLQKYPLATQLTALIQKHMSMKCTTIVNVDGYVFNGNIFHWSISDNIYSVTKPQCFLATIHPSNLPNDKQKQVWKLFDTVILRLVEFGFNNSFANVEVFVCQSGEVRLMEINPRFGLSLQALSRISDKRNALQAELWLAEGINPVCPPFISNQHALLGYIRTYGSGKCGDFINYSRATSEFAIERKSTESIDGSCASGEVLAKICCIGNSRDEIMTKYWAACRQILIKPELSIWQ